MLRTSLLLSILAMTAIVGVRYLAVSGGFAWLTRLRRPGLYTGLDRQMRREIGWSLLSAFIYGAPAGFVAWGWQAHGWTRIYADASAYPLWWLPASVLLYLLAPRHLVLLDAPLAAPAAAVPAGPRRPPCQPAADRLGGDELPSAGGGDRRDRHPRPRLRDSDPFRRPASSC